MTGTRPTRTPSPQSTFYLITHIPPNTSWINVFLYLFNGQVNRSVSVYEQLRDVSRRGAPEGEFFLVVGVDSSIGRSAVRLMVQQQGFRSTEVSEALANRLIAQYRMSDEELLELAAQLSAGTSANTVAL
ncbi:uncharacterized protein SRS1_14791 [Sporisorium reilianum f. sp. reilianum]|uniref:Uncharacterized protein n=1 Tax=Sporisorium reilianum f. sp. reilianum TaxID=72559 RepID=A0A2N8UGR0_9BASI|nr:uncharacterized protein SRS1_14791 [Sporisorium reilianum f. sp. reilianum]